MAEARAAAVTPLAGESVGTPSRPRDLRCDAKVGISFRGPPTGLAVGFGRNGRLPYGPETYGPIHPGRAKWVPGFELPLGKPEFGVGRPLGVDRLEGTGCLTEHASQSVALV
ncbi:hypothetical protein GCM10009654_43570 [Streptomyces hebeiensis]|uniref:Uncharacterized protein n=1 Tax=Streptomyces hebeiensis TaxID=229486 RepID=A0ABN1UZ03_9ACTN